MTDFCLSHEELCDLTGRIRKTAQIAALNTMGIIHRVRGDGTPAVLRSHVNGLMGDKAEPKRYKRVEPDWTGLNA